MQIQVKVNSHEDQESHLDTDDGCDHVWVILQGLGRHGEQFGDEVDLPAPQPEHERGEAAEECQEESAAV